MISALLLLLISAFAGLFGSVLGLGGGIFIVPVLTIAFGIEIRYAVGASIVAVIATSSGAAASYVRDRFTNVKLAILLEVATATGALMGVWLSSFVSAKYLFLLFGGLLLYSAYVMIGVRDEHPVTKCTPESLAGRLRLEASYFDPLSRRSVCYAVSNFGLGFCLMWVAGVVSALLGIGSGILKIPAMDRIMKLPIKVSSATSNFMIGVTASASAGAYLTKGDVLPWLAGPVAIGALIGAWFGSRLMPRLPNRLIRKIFVVVLILVAIQMIARGVGYV